MKDLTRRQFLENSAVLSAGAFSGFTGLENTLSYDSNMENKVPNLIGAYGPWASDFHGNRPRKLSYRFSEFKNLEVWRNQALSRVNECLVKPAMPSTPEVTVHQVMEYDGLTIEDLSWNLPYGAPTKAYLLKPKGATGKLPGILAFHDHGGNKYFGRRKITRTGEQQHPMMKEHQEHYYEGKAWANEIAKRGYAVLVADAFTFASRRVLLNDVPEYNRNGLNDANPEDQKNIDAYNQWASNHEHIMAKSLLCAGTCWPAVFLMEDQIALNILCERDDVDAKKVGCAGLSGGGLRTVFTGGLDHRIQCAVCVGFMSTWHDFLLYKSFTHTWMTYVPILANDLDFPEILGIRAPLPTMVLNDEDDFLYTLPEMKKADQVLKEVFAKAGAVDRYKCNFYPGPHKFDQQMQRDAFEWFDHWLK